MEFASDPVAGMVDVVMGSPTVVRHPPEGSLYGEIAALGLKNRPAAPELRAAAPDTHVRRRPALRMTRPLISFFAAALLVACTAGTNAPTTGRGGDGGSNSAGTAGKGGGGPGVAGTTGAAGVISIGGTSGSGAGGRTCGLQKFDVERKPAEVLLLLDRSKSMIEDTTSDGVTLKWNAVLPALKQV